MHPVALDLVDRDRSEGVDSDMEVDPGHPDTSSLESGHHLGGEVKTGGGGRGRPGPAGEHRLITPRVSECAFEVGRERDLAGALDGGLHVVRHQIDHHHALVGSFDDDRGEPVELDLHTGAEAAGGTRQRLPSPVGPGSQDQQFDLPSGPGPLTDETGASHPGLVDHHQVIGTEQVGEVEKAVIRHVPGVEDPGIVPRLDRRLGDGRLREVVVEFLCTHPADVRAGFPGGPTAAPDRDGCTPGRWRHGPGVSS